MIKFKDLELIKNPRTLLNYWGYAVVALAAFLYFVTIQFATAFMMGEDSYYHIKFAYLSRVNGIMHSFPWAQFSLWKDHFYDKEFLYHLLLQPFTFGDLSFGGKLAAVMFGTALFVTLYHVIRSNKFKFPLFWTLMGLCTSSYFLYRINITRPQTLSILMSLIVVHVQLNKRYKLIVIATALYTLAHTGAYISILYAIIIAVTEFWRDRTINWKIPVYTLAGFLIGMLVHPNFPNNVTSWYIQNINVFMVAWTGTKNQLGIAGELRPINTKDFLYSFMPLLIPYFIMTWTMFTKKVQCSLKTMSLFAIASAYLFAFMNSLRFNEMWTPFSLFFFASYCTDTWEEFNLKEFIKRNRIFSVAVVMIVVAFYAETSREAYNSLYRDYFFNSNKPYNEDAAWLKYNLEDGAQVYTCDWDDAPYLFFGNDKVKYLVFLDPHFMYDWDRDIWNIWYKTSNGQMTDPYQSLKYVFGAKYVYCTSDFKGVINQMRTSPNFKLLRETKDSVVFEVL